MNEQQSTWDDITVIVAPTDLNEVEFSGSVVIVTGTSEDGQTRITFAGDHRPICALLDDVYTSGESLSAVVPQFMVLRQRRF